MSIYRYKLVWHLQKKRSKLKAAKTWHWYLFPPLFYLHNYHHVSCHLICILYVYTSVCLFEPPFLSLQIRFSVTHTHTHKKKPCQGERSNGLRSGPRGQERGRGERSERKPASSRNPHSRWEEAGSGAGVASQNHLTWACDVPAEQCSRGSCGDLATPQKCKVL